MADFKYLVLLVCVIFVQNAYAKISPDYIHPCREEDSVCLLQSSRDALPEFVKGLPELGVPTLDPFIIEKLSIPLPGLKVSFYEGKVSGFKNCIIDKAEQKAEKHRLSLDFHCNITLKGKYDAVGRLLVFPIDGAGDAKIKLTNLKMKIAINYKYAKDDKNILHYALKNYKYSFDYGDKVTLNLTNLFKNSPELSDTVLSFLNDNWRVVAGEFGKPLVDYAVELAVRTIEKFFLAVPYDELCLTKQEQKGLPSDFNDQIAI